MSEIFDKLLIRIIFTLYICASYFVFKYAHLIFYPTHRKQILKKITPSINYVNTLSFFARIIGMAIIYSSLEFNEYIGMAFSTIHFFIWSTIGIISYLLTLYLTDWLIFQVYKFTEEVQKKKNIAYGLISFTNAIGVAFIIKQLFIISQYSIIKYLILWSLTVLIYSGATRFYRFYSSHSFNKLIIQKNVGLSFGYAGFILCHALILSSALMKSPLLLSDYLLEVILKMLLGLVLVPILLFFFKKVFISNKFDDPAKPAFTDLNSGIQECLIFIFTGVFISHLLHFVHLNLNFQLVSVMILGFIFLYKQIHVFIYPFPRTKFLSFRFKPINSCDLIHIFSRFIGIILIYSRIYNVATPDEFILWSFIGFGLYLASLFISENIIFFNFNYHDEISKNENYAYALVNFVNAICQGFIISKILETAESSIMNLLVFWLQSLVLYGLGTKFFKYINNLSFNSLMIQKNIGLAIAFSGFLLGNTIILLSAYTQDNFDLTGFITQVLLKINLGILIMPLFLSGISYVLKISKKPEASSTDSLVHLGQGIYSFSIYLVASLVTSIIIGQIHFGTIYPFF